MHHRGAEDLHPLGEGFAVEGQRAAVLLALVVGEVGWGVVGAPLPGELAHRQRGLHGQRELAARPAGGVGGQDLVAAEGVGGRHDVRGGPARLADPPTRPVLVGRRGRHALLHPDAQHGLGHDVVVDVAQPVVPPADELLEEADGRAGLTEVRVLVRPGPDQAFAGDVERGEQPEHRVRVAVGPAAHGEHRARDVGVVLADRAVLPVGVATLVAQPLRQPEPAAAQPLVPHLAPPLADDVRVRRAGVVGEHRRRPREVVGEQAAAHVVHVVGVPVVGRAGGDDGLRLGGRRAATWRVLNPPQEIPIIPVRPSHQGCAAIQASTSSASDSSCSRYSSVSTPSELPLPRRSTRTPANPCPREVGVVDRVPHRGEVALPVRDELEDGGNGVQVGRLGPPDPSGEAGAVRQRDADLAVLFDAMRKPFPVDEPHPAGSSNSNGSPPRACSYLRISSSSSSAPR